MARRGGGHRPSRSSSRRSFSSGSSRSHYHHRRHHYGSYGNNDFFSFIIRVVIILAGCFYLLIDATPEFDVVTSKEPRTKVQPAASYQSDCIIDQANFFTQPTYLGRQLEEFYNKTGVQPIILIHEYDPNLTSDYSKELWATSYYDTYIENETCFLLVYFLEKNPTYMGYFAYANGHLTDSLMDSEAIDIFWEYIDKYWLNTSKTSEDELLTAFTKTADAIMSSQKAVSDRKYMLYAGIGLVVFFIVICFINKKTGAVTSTYNPSKKATESSDDYLDNYMG